MGGNVLGVGHTVVEIYNKPTMMLVKWVFQQDNVVICKFGEIMMRFLGKEGFNDNKDTWTMII